MEKWYLGSLISSSSGFDPQLRHHGSVVKWYRPLLITRSPRFDSWQNHHTREQRWYCSMVLTHVYAGSIPAPSAKHRSNNGNSLGFQPGRCGFKSRPVYHTLAKGIGGEFPKLACEGSTPSEGAMPVCANWQSGDLQTVVSVGSNPTTGTMRVWRNWQTRWA